MSCERERERERWREREREREGERSKLKLRMCVCVPIFKSNISQGKINFTTSLKEIHSHIPQIITKSDYTTFRKWVD